ncbi:hypothetical protein [Pontiella sulfatireligans]|uniref:hypothetical protein n=1 Tax=Pontiella sulfatireligans TaxID=2750658 RepID=UPI00109CCD28|nr:hypothetical protein [Pontiella sulfatireligans]
MKPKSSILPFKLNLSLTAEFFLRRGFYIHEQNGNQLHLLKSGSALAITTKRIPLELSFKISEQGTEVSLSYGTFVLFDTGDLAKELKRIISQLEQFKEKLV